MYEIAWVMQEGFQLGPQLWTGSVTVWRSIRKRASVRGVPYQK
jgi:hypothetical protein